MIFTSLLKLMESNLDAVYTFLCRICDESNSELTLEEAGILDSVLNEFKDLPAKDFHHFFSLFNNYKCLQDKIKELAPDGKYGYFVNEEEIPDFALQGGDLILVSIYISLFGYDCIKVPVPSGCHHLR